MQYLVDDAIHYSKYQSINTQSYSLKLSISIKFFCRTVCCFSFLFGLKVHFLLLFHLMQMIIWANDSLSHRYLKNANKSTSYTDKIQRKIHLCTLCVQRRMPKFKIDCFIWFAVVVVVVVDILEHSFANRINIEYFLDRPSSKLNCDFILIFVERKKNGTCYMCCIHFCCRRSFIFFLFIDTTWERKKKDKYHMEKNVNNIMNW